LDPIAAEGGVIRGAGEKHRIEILQSRSFSLLLDEVGPPERFMNESGLAKISFGPPIIFTSATSAFDL
jgi:hypothetical protein